MSIMFQSLYGSCNTTNYCKKKKNEERANSCRSPKYIAKKVQVRVNCF